MMPGIAGGCLIRVLIGIVSGSGFGVRDPEPGARKCKGRYLLGNHLAAAQGFTQA